MKVSKMILIKMCGNLVDGVVGHGAVRENEVALGYDLLGSLGVAVAKVAQLVGCVVVEAADLVEEVRVALVPDGLGRRTGARVRPVAQLVRGATLDWRRRGLILELVLPRVVFLNDPKKLVSFLKKFQNNTEGPFSLDQRVLSG